MKTQLKSVDKSGKLYILPTERGYISRDKRYDIQEKDIEKVGKKYITVRDAYHTQFDIETGEEHDKNGYSPEHVAFATREDAEEEILRRKERDAIIGMHNVYSFLDCLTLEELQRLHAIVDELWTKVKERKK